MVAVMGVVLSRVVWINCSDEPWKGCCTASSNWDAVWWWRCCCKTKSYAIDVDGTDICCDMGWCMECDGVVAEAGLGDAD